MYYFRLLLVCLVTLFFFSCTVYDVDTAGNSTLAGSLTKAVNKDRARLVKEETQEDEEPVYVDYSKSNPLLRHDEEYDEETDYINEDPFAEDVDFSSYKEMKKRQQAKRRMEKEHKISNKEDDAMSLW
jgi:hypothetical protein